MSNEKKSLLVAINRNLPPGQRLRKSRSWQQATLGAYYIVDHRNFVVAGFISDLDTLLEEIRREQDEELSWKMRLLPIAAGVGA